MRQSILNKGLNPDEITKAHIMRVIEKLKAADESVYPSSVARMLGVTTSALYRNPDLIESIYKYGSKPIGPDIVIQDLFSKNKSYKRKLDKLQKKLVEAEINAKRSYSDGFSEGAAMNFNSKVEKSNSDLDLMTELETDSEEWARGVLFLKQDEILTEHSVKSAYRRLIRILHPDQSGLEDNEFVHTLNKAYDILLKSLI